MDVIKEQDIYVGREVFGVDLTAEDVRKSWGRPAEELLPMLFGRGGDKRSWQEMRDIFWSYDPQFPRRLLPHALTTLNTLDRANIDTGVITSGVRERVCGYMTQAGLNPGRFRFVHTSPEIEECNAAGLPILSKALGELALAPHEAMLVGDEVNNMNDALEAGTDFVIVANGTRTPEELLAGGVPPGHLIRDLRQLPAFIGLPT